MSGMMFVLASYGESLVGRDWWSAFTHLGESVATTAGLRLTHLGFSSAVGGKPPKRKEYRYSSRALERLSSMFDPDTVSSASVTVAGPDGELNLGARMDLTLSVPYQSRPYIRALLVAEPGLLFGSHPGHLDQQVAVQLLDEFDSMFAQKYALAHLMPRERGPGFYFADLYTQRLCSEEEADLDRWLSQRDLFVEKIRDVYWGNLVSERHGGKRRTDLVRAIAEAVGTDRLLAMSAGRFFFSLPFDIRDEASYEANLRIWRRRVRAALADFDVLM